MVDPKVIIRMGSHAEKDYIEKTARYLDGIIVGANLFETKPIKPEVLKNYLMILIS